MDKLNIRLGRIFSTVTGLTLILLAFFILILAVLPYSHLGHNESDANLTVEIKSDNYKLNQSSSFPIGAFKSGNNIFLLDNNSNEKVTGTFLIKVKGESCDQRIEVTDSENRNIKTFFIANGQELDILRDIKIEPHSNISIYYAVAKNSDNFCYEDNYSDYPLSIQGWKILNAKL